MNKTFDESYKSIDDGLFIKVEGYPDRIFEIMKHLWYQIFEVIDYAEEYRPHIVPDDGDTKQCQHHYEKDGYTTKVVEDYIEYKLLDIIQEHIIDITVYPSLPNKITTKLTLEESKLVLEYKKNQFLIAKNVIERTKTEILAKTHNLNLPIS